MSAESAKTAANAAQLAASNPATSAFVAASAGSGKTKLLTDRLLRLMLAGTPPGKILCLTYTKAAAAEMAIRLNNRLGRWVVLDSATLDQELEALAVRPSEPARIQARRLFAEVLDLPGGMKIQTIHAFCQSLLRRFPLEAGISPHFELADDADAALRLRAARETALADHAQIDAIAALAAATNEQDFVALVEQFAAARDIIEPLLKEFGPVGLAAMQRAALAAGDHPPEAVLREAVTWPREPHVKHAWARIAERGNPSGQTVAARALDWLAKPTDDRPHHWADWLASHFTTAGSPRGLDRFFGKHLAAERDALHDELAAEQTRIDDIEDAAKAAALSALNRPLIGLIAAILAADREAKTAAAALGYADLVTRTGTLLIDPGAAWVLYKLDGGIDHLLLDEVQDTAAAQWDIAGAIADDFFSGAGAREPTRTIFAVGDAKQSIFSFQGADLASFEANRQKFRTKVEDAGGKFLDGQLDVSFRSTAPVLALTDAVFAAGPARAGVVAAGATLKHQVSRAGQGGTVTLWPLTPATNADDPPPWDVPNDYAEAESAKAVLAREIASWIANRLADHDTLPSRARPVRPGDFLILVRQRDALVGALTRAIKARNIPLAGLDRMVLTEQPAVSDLLALCDALILPEDDLAFGQFLASPLGGLTDDELMALALNRRGPLVAALSSQRETFPEAYAFFDGLRQRADFITPHALLAEALGPRGGRARLLARLGPEAAEPIDELLAEALSFSRRAPGALQAFLHHLRQAGAQIRREADAGGDVVRIMTVHGAKGLQAPIVILPDTTGMPKHDPDLFWLTPPQQPKHKVPIFCPQAALRTRAVADALADGKAASLAEYNRLLYVALTRAEDELLICGAAPGRTQDAACWYELVKSGFARLQAEDDDGIQRYTAPQTAPPDQPATYRSPAAAALPSWAGAAPDWRAAPPPAETARPEPLAPSRSTEDTVRRAIAASPLAGAAGQLATREAALAKGSAIHALLQHLPDLPPAARRPAAAKFLDGIAALPQAARPEVITAVLAVLENPALAPLFGPGSRAEVPLAGIVGDVEIGGLVDRLAVTPEQVLLADYKTDRHPPATPADIPPAYLRQLAAYAAILTQIFPNRQITCLLIFTQTAAIIEVPSALLTAHRPADPSHAKHELSVPHADFG